MSWEPCILAVFERNHVCIGLGLGGMRSAIVQSFYYSREPTTQPSTDYAVDYPEMLKVVLKYKKPRRSE